MRRVLLHCPGSVGHHGVYVRLLLEHVARHPELELQLGLLVPADFRQWFPDVLELAHASGVAVLTSLIPSFGTGRAGLSASAPLSFRELSQCVQEFGAEHCLMLHADLYAQLLLPFGVPLGARFSGILFRPMMHYGTFAGRLTAFDRLRAARQAASLRRAARHPELARFFWLDPFGAAYARKMDPSVSSKHEFLPDPLSWKEPTASVVERSRRRFRVSSDRRVFLAFGPPGGRKGTLQAITSLPLVARALQGRVHFLMVGAMDENERRVLSRAVEEVAPRFAGEITLVDEFVAEEEASALFELSDVILLPYQRHVGSSGVLLSAARATKPTITSDYGLIGEWTRRHRLGLTVNSEDPLALATAIGELAANPDCESFDPKSARDFASQFDPTVFSENLCRALNK